MSRVVLISIIAALLSAAPAVAQDPTRDAYGGARNVASEVATKDQGVNPGSGVRGTTAEGVRPANAARTTTAAVKPLRGTELPFDGDDDDVGGPWQRLSRPERPRLPREGAAARRQLNAVVHAHLLHPDGGPISRLKTARDETALVSVSVAR